VHFLAAKVNAIRKTGVCAYAHAQSVSLTYQALHHPRVARMESTSNINRSHVRQHGGVVSKPLAQISVQIDLAQRIFYARYCVHRRSS
jgi:hypothetical protein